MTKRLRPKPTWSSKRARREPHPNLRAARQNDSYVLWRFFSRRLGAALPSPAAHAPSRKSDPRLGLLDNLSIDISTKL